MYSESDRKSVTKNVADEIANYIQKYEVDTPIFTDDLYRVFPDIKKGSIRQVIKRLFDKGMIERAEPGVYFKPKSHRILNISKLPSSKIIEEKYLKNNEQTIGYRSGINFANQLGLTTQIANVEFIISNRVSNKKRKISINKGKVIINAPRCLITSQNYKLLQILDLMNDFENLSEIDVRSATPIIRDYLKELELTQKEIDLCIASYPLQAQVNFYKMGVYHDLIERKGSI